MIVVQAEAIRAVVHFFALTELHVDLKDEVVGQAVGNLLLRLVGQGLRQPGYGQGQAERARIGAGRCGRFQVPSLKPI